MHWVWWSVSAWFATLPVGTLTFCVLQPAQERQGLNDWFGFSKGMFARMRAFPPRSLAHNRALRQCWGWRPRGWSLASSTQPFPAWLGIQRHCLHPNVNLKSQSECSLEFSSVLGCWLCWWLSSLRWLWLGSGSILWYFLCRDMGGAEGQKSLLLLPRGQ